MAEISKSLAISRLTMILKMSGWKVFFFADVHAYLMAVFYILLVTQTLGYDLLWKVLALIVSLGVYLIAQFHINDFYDMPTDKMAGRYREVHDMPKIQVVILILLVVLLSYAVTLILIGQPLYTLIYTITYLVGLFYSAPPLRFKGRGIYGIISNILMEKDLPLLLIISFFQYFTVDAMFLLVLFSLWHLEGILTHQYVDYEVDLKAGVRTFVVEIGSKKTLKILKFLQPIVAVLFILFCLIIMIQMPYSAVFFIPLALGFFLLKILRRSNLFTTEPGKFGHPRFYVEEEKVGHLRWSLSCFLGACFEGPFPLFAGMILTLRFPPYMVLLLLLVVSQYYLIRGHYQALFQGAYLLVKRKLDFSKTTESM